SKVIDDEVERILRAEEERAHEVLSKHRGGLNAIARALLDNEIIDGREVGRLVDEAYGGPVHTEGAKSVPQFGTSDNGIGHTNGSETPEPAVVPAVDQWPPPPWPTTDPPSSEGPKDPTP
ncbi:MAG TPA: hypothetical protein VG298_11705, partial [Acidimicrobiales bacterium]|nr:hypothetical protein [Acidimicrobiales bacterium]